MHAVGLAVADTSRGDADGNGKVERGTPCLILSAVVALDVSSFQVGHVINPCASGTPSTVTVQPAPVDMVTGDTFHVAATVAHRRRTLIGGRNLVWASSDPTVVTVDGGGKLTAVSTGSATINGAVAPGVAGHAEHHGGNQASLGGESADRAGQRPVSWGATRSLQHHRAGGGCGGPE